MRRRDDAHVDGALGVRAERAHDAALDHVEQLRLERQRHFADLVEQERAAARLHEEAVAALRCAGERAFAVSEELALEQRSPGAPRSSP